MSGLLSRSGGPVTFRYLRNTQKAPQAPSGDPYSQSIEPAGRYIIADDLGRGPTVPGWTGGEMTFQKPLHIDFGGAYGTETNWKTVLSDAYGATGAALSRALRAEGYDGIVTHDKYGTSEIVDLTVVGSRTAARTYFHGTTVELQPGDVVSPASERGGMVVHRGETDPDYAYASSSESDAAFWAELAWNNTDTGDMHVYEVRPLGEVEPDPNRERGGRGGFSALDGDVRSSDGFEVVRKVSAQRTASGRLLAAIESFKRESWGGSAGPSSPADLEDPKVASGWCGQVAIWFNEHLTKHGIPHHPGYGTPGHVYTVVVEDGSHIAVDWTYRQFDPTAPIPVVRPEVEYIADHPWGSLCEYRHMQEQRGLEVKGSMRRTAMASMPDGSEEDVDLSEITFSHQRVTASDYYSREDMALLISDEARRLEDTRFVSSTHLRDFVTPMCPRITSEKFMVILADQPAPYSPNGTLKGAVGWHRGKRLPALVLYPSAGRFTAMHEVSHLNAGADVRQKGQNDEGHGQHFFETFLTLLKQQGYLDAYNGLYTAAIDLYESIDEERWMLVANRTALFEGGDYPITQHSRTAYRIQHQPGTEGPPLHDLLEGDSWFPEDVYDTPQHYVWEPSRQTIDTVRRARGNPEMLVEVFRALPKGITTFETGNWVYLDKQLAVRHGYHPTDESLDMPVITARVPAKLVRNGGNDLMEWGYAGPPVQGTVVHEGGENATPHGLGFRASREGRAGGDKRGNSYARAVRKQWLLNTYGDGSTCPCFYCGKRINYFEVEADRVEPGGSYARKSIVPACRACNLERSDQEMWGWDWDWEDWRLEQIASAQSPSAPDQSSPEDGVRATTSAGAGDDQWTARSASASQMRSAPSRDVRTLAMEGGTVPSMRHGSGVMATPTRSSSPRPVSERTITSTEATTSATPGRTSGSLDSEGRPITARSVAQPIQTGPTTGRWTGRGLHSGPTSRGSSPSTQTTTGRSASRATSGSTSTGSGKPTAVIWDLDGSLASCAWRLHHIENGNRDWRAFFDGIPSDAPVPEQVARLKRDAAEGHSIQIVTGRPAKTRRATEWWLAENGIPYDTLHMRPGHDQTSDHEVKRRILDHLLQTHDVVRAYDDRDGNLSMFEQAGIEAVRLTDPALPPRTSATVAEDRYWRTTSGDVWRKVQVTMNLAEVVDLMGHPMVFAATLMEELTKERVVERWNGRTYKGLGKHWSEDERIARNFDRTEAFVRGEAQWRTFKDEWGDWDEELDPLGTLGRIEISFPVLIHGHVESEAIRTDKEVWREYNMVTTDQRYDLPIFEREVPIKQGGDVHVKAIEAYLPSRNDLQEELDSYTTKGRKKQPYAYAGAAARWTKFPIDQRFTAAMNGRTALAPTYSAWVIEPEDIRAMLNRLRDLGISPAHPEVLAHHVTVAFPDTEPPEARDTIKVVGYGSNDDLDALVVEIDGSIHKPDGGIWHVTLSKQPHAAPYKAADMLAGGWERIGPISVPVRASLESGHTPRFASLGIDCWHVAPSAARASIEMHGLDHARRADQSYDTEGTYVWLDREAAEDMQEYNPDHDLWRVDMDGVDYTPDPNNPEEAVWTAEPLGLDRLTLVREGSWRPVSEMDYWTAGDAVIAVDKRGMRNTQHKYTVYRFGKEVGIRHDLHEAIALIERDHGPCDWEHVAIDPVEATHYYFGPTTEFTEPSELWVVEDLPVSTSENELLDALFTFSRLAANVKTLIMDKAAEKDIRKIKNRQEQRSVVESIDALLKDPMPHGHSKLSGHDDLYRVRDGKYRIVYKFDDRTLRVIMVGRRDDVYRQLERRASRQWATAA